MSFTATNSSAVSSRQARNTLRPMRPKPLMPTRIAIGARIPNPLRSVKAIAPPSRPLTPPEPCSRGSPYSMIPNLLATPGALAGLAAQAGVPQDTVLDMMLGSGPVAQVFRAGCQELQRLKKAKRANPGDEGEVELGEIETVQRAVHRARTQEVTRLERGLTFLATTASTAPFVGLFGTVWGIMTAFRGLSTTTSSSIQAVAPGIAEALIATAVGLAAAIPAVVMYNRFSRQLRVLTAEMDTFASEFLNIAERHFLK